MSFLNSIINNSKKFEDPFEHWELNKPLTNEALEEIANVEEEMPVDVDCSMQ